MAAKKEDKQGLEVEIARLKVERTSLLLELKTSRDEVYALHSKACKDKEAMVEDYQKPLEQIFTYGYRCCAFKHGIHGDRPRILDGMPYSTDPLSPKFLSNLGCPNPNNRAKAVEVHPVETTKDLVEGVVVEEQG